MTDPGEQARHVEEASQSSGVEEASRSSGVQEAFRSSGVEVAAGEEAPLRFVASVALLFHTTNICCNVGSALCGNRNFRNSCV